MQFGRTLTRFHAISFFVSIFYGYKLQTTELSRFCFTFHWQSSVVSQLHVLEFAPDLLVIGGRGDGVDSGKGEPYGGPEPRGPQPRCALVQSPRSGGRQEGVEGVLFVAGVGDPDAHHGIERGYYTEGAACGGSYNK